MSIYVNMSIYVVSHDISPVRGTRAFGCLRTHTECCPNSRKGIEMSVASSRYAHGFYICVTNRFDTSHVHDISVRDTYIECVCMRITWNLTYRLGLRDFTRVCVGVKGMTGTVDVMQHRLLSTSCCHSSAVRVCACGGGRV